MLKSDIMLKQILKNLACLFIIVLTLSSCTKEDKVTIKFSSWGSETEISELKPLILDFEQKNPDIKIEFLHIPQNYFEKLHLLVASNTTPDVVFINNINGAIYEENNIFYDLTEYLKEDKDLSSKSFYPQSLKSFTYNNKLYAIPRDVSNLVVFYNKDLFNKYHIKYPKKEWNLQDFLKTAQLLSKDTNNDGQTDLFGVGFDVQPLFWMPFVWSNGGYLLSSDLKHLGINNSHTIQGIQFYSDLRNKYHVAPSAAYIGSATTSQLFMQEKIAMQINGRWSVPRFRKDIKFNWDIAQFPKGAKGSIVDADSSGWAISQQSKHKKEAWRFIKFLASYSSISSFTKDGLIIPARIDVANSNIFLNKNQKPQHSDLFLKIIPKSIPTPANKNYKEITDVLNDALEPVWNGSKSAKEAITPNIQKKLKRLL